MSKNFHQGRYQVQNVAKYIGKDKTPRFLSSWELEVFRKFDLSSAVIAWGAEAVIIQYFNPVTQKKSRYIIDIYVKYKNSKGKTIEELVEIKPYKETQKPRNTRGKKRNSVVYENATYIRNKAKWAAAEIYAKEHGMTFRLLTERGIFF